MSCRANSYLVKVKCDCGTERLTQRKYLLNGKSKSCGCDGVFVGVTLADSTLMSTSQPRFGRPREGVWRHSCGHRFHSRVTTSGPRGSCPACRDNDRSSTHGEAAHENRSREYQSWRHMRERCKNGHPDYGGRGIRCCKRWDRYENFLKDMGRAPPGFTLDRINVNGHYSPSNCRWASWRTQARNTRRSNALDTRKLCQHGHPWNESTIYKYPDGRRACRLCLGVSRQKHLELRGLK